MGVNIFLLGTACALSPEPWALIRLLSYVWFAHAIDLSSVDEPYMGSHSRVSVFVKKDVHFSVAQLHSQEPTQPQLELLLIHSASQRRRRIAKDAPRPLVLIVPRHLLEIFVVSFPRGRRRSDRGRGKTGVVKRYKRECERQLLPQAGVDRRNRKYKVKRMAQQVSKNTQIVDLALRLHWCSNHVLRPALEYHHSDSDKTRTQTSNILCRNGLHASRYLAAVLELMHDLLLYRFQIVLRGVLRKEVVGAPGFVWSVSRRPPEGNSKLHEVNIACV